jgi:hypothetical protein
VPRGFVTQPYALPLSRNCMPRMFNHGSSSTSSGTAGEKTGVLADVALTS